jgi:hypothetical protein
MFRNATLHRVVASFFLLELVGSLAAPSLSYALMGPGQPEFTSYESSGSTDMVNLSTGDLTYNVPVLEVPGPETTFSLPLTYRAGIRPEQEASWVGLGWSMNPGAIVRNVNGYPDDASGEMNVNSFSDPGHKGWYGGVPGLLQLGWDSETGRTGSASLLGFVSASWSGGKLQSGDIVGIGAARGEGFTLDPIKLAAAAFTVATIGAGAGASAAASGASNGMGMTAKVLSNVAGSLATSVGIAAFGKTGPTGGGFNRPTIVKEKTWFRTNYWVFINDTTKEAMFGSLYFDRMSNNINPNFGSYSDANNFGPDIFDGPAKYAAGQSRKGYKFNYSRDYNNNGNFVTETAADIQQATDPLNRDYHTTSQNPISIAHDDFTVMGPGVSGSIRPQRLDVGSVAYPRNMLEHHDKYNLVSWQNYKVPFRYENTASNTYTHVSNVRPVYLTQPIGVDDSQWGKSKLILTEEKFYKPDARTQGNRKGLTDNRLVQGKQVDWFTNNELADAYDNTPAKPLIKEFADPKRNETKQYQAFDGYTPVTGPPSTKWPFLPTHSYEPHYVPATMTSSNMFRKLRPESGIGAFVITAEDGTTYHYSLPVYHLRQYARTTQTTDPAAADKGLAINRMGGKGNEAYNYATAWLLTAITGPDYVDQGTLGVVDDQDIGTWVKFSYGKFSSQFKWRQPYVGTETNAAQQGYSFQEGAKETYYLNTISTRTHTALFIKSVRKDGRGHYTPGASTPEDAKKASNLGIDERTPASSLRLDEVIVVSNDDLNAIKTSTGFGEDTNGNAASQTGLGGNDTYANVLDQNDIASGANIRSLLNQKALKRVVFNYSYRLCVGAPNSFASASSPPALGTSYTATNRMGKLTLESIATYGANSVKLIPDFRFDYGFNPKYDPIKWDGFGMYASGATATSRRPATDFATASQDGSAWSLNKITNPLGSTTEITYERDQYSSVSEYYTGVVSLTDQGIDKPNGVFQGDNTVDLTTIFQVDQVVKLKGDVFENYDVSVRYGPYSQNDSYTVTERHNKSFEGGYRIAALSANEVAFTSLPPDPIQNGMPDYTSGDATYSYYDTGYGGCFANLKVPKNLNGGDIRVAAVTTRDENSNKYVVKYDYTNSRQVNRNSSGVVSKEPEYIKKPDFNLYYEFEGEVNLYKLFDYPATPVMYGQTTVLRGNFSTPDDIDQREVYAFHTANSSMVSVGKDATEFAAYYPFLSVSPSIAIKRQNNTVNVDLGLLGQAKSIKKYNRRGTLEFSTVFNYNNSLPNADGIAGQGIFTENALTSEFLDVDNSTDNPSIYNVNWTTKKYLPTTLLGTTTTTNNIAATTTNKLYDFYTGTVLETSLVNSIGDAYRSKTVLAYTLYAGMGPKSEKAGNQHMLMQTAATSFYKENGTGTPTVLSTGIQTWKNDWPYRSYDAASDSYKADVGANAPLYRQHRTYVWQSARLNPDGSYAGYTPYNWTQTRQVLGWLNVGEVMQYDHYSRPLESKDVNGKYAAQKTGYNQGLTVAAAQNARYTEFAYSGAEDAITSGASASHFGGEVRDGGRQSSAQAHTGQFSSLLTAANPAGFTYKAVAGDANDLNTNRTYRASAWVYNADPATAAANGARLYSNVNGTIKEVGIADPSTKRAGNWYLLNLYFDLPASTAGQPVTVGCRNVGGADIYVDDFRFHPVDAPLQATVYDPATRQPTFTLDNDNLYTRYQYDEAGKLVKVYREVLTPDGITAPAERLIKESSYNYAQMKTPNWLDEGLVCATNAAGQTTGYLARQLRDVNSASPTFNQVTRTTTNELSADCPAAACSGMQRYNNATQSCETPQEVEVSCDGSTGKFFHFFQYQYQNGDFYPSNAAPQRVRRLSNVPCRP